MPISVAAFRDLMQQGLVIPAHPLALTENLKLDELASKNVHEFAVIMTPLKIKGGTGSTVAPIAVR